MKGLEFLCFIKLWGCNGKSPIIAYPLVMVQSRFDARKCDVFGNRASISRNLSAMLYSLFPSINYGTCCIIGKGKYRYILFYRYIMMIQLFISLMSSGLIEALNWVAAVEKDKESKKVTMAFLPIFGFFNFFFFLMIHSKTETRQKEKFFTQIRIKWGER